MEISIRAYIKKNFKNTTVQELRSSIEESIKEQDEVLLPGMGVLFETMWNNLDKEKQDMILEVIKNNI